MFTKYFESELGYINVRHKEFHPSQVIFEVAKEYKSDGFFTWLKKQKQTLPSNEKNFDRIAEFMSAKFDKEWGNAFEQLETKEMRFAAFEKLVKKYYSIVRNTVVDFVPKATMTHLLYASRNEVESYLRRKVKPEDTADLTEVNASFLAECAEFTKEDAALNDIIESLNHLKESSESLAESGPSATFPKSTIPLSSTASSSSNSSTHSLPLKQENTAERSSLANTLKFPSITIDGDASNETTKIEPETQEKAREKSAEEEDSSIIKTGIKSLFSRSEKKD